MIQFDPSVLLSYYQTRNGLGGSGASSTSSASSSSGHAPTAPWRAAVPTSDPDLAKAVLQGARFIDPNALKINVPGAGSDYRNMFALYTGLQSMQALAEQMQSKTITSLEKTQVQTRFAAGMTELENFLATKPFTNAQVVQGAVSTTAKASQGVPAETDSYTTGVLYTGAADGQPPAFQGSVAFAMDVSKYADGKTLGTPTTVNFDLSEMGSTPRTMSNVVVYLNSKLAAAGVTTRFANVRTAATPQTLKAGGKTITLPAGADSYQLKINGESSEQISLSASAAKPAVYMAQSSGVTTGSTPSAVQQLVKYDTDPTASGSTASPTGRDFSDALGPEVQAVRATQTDADGSVYVLADVNAKTGGQTIKGAQDVSVLKYDSTGKLLYTRTLGASNTASGYAMSLSADGKQLAIAGSITGTLDQNDSTQTSTTTTDSFVSVFDTTAGDELWTQRRGASADDKANAVTFGADGTVYVAGTTGSAMPGATAQGGTDGYVAAYAGHQQTVPGSDPIWVSQTKFVTQFGTAADDRATGVTVSGGAVVVSSVDNGHAVLRRYDLQPSGAPVLGATRDLGDLQGGTVAGVTVNNDGSVIVAGSTHNGALDAGQTTTAYAGGEAGFVAKLSADLTPAAATDRVTYLGSGADQTADTFTVSGGQVYVAGRVVTTPPADSGRVSAHDGYIAQIDPTTGAIGWTQSVTNQVKEVMPTAITVAASGASVLDRLGLPSGTMAYTSSQTLVANTSLRPGDEFYVTRGQGGAKSAVVIDPNETLTTLAAKVARASGYTATATVVTLNGHKQLSIAPLNARFAVGLQAGPTGRDALAPLGLSEGLVSNDSHVATAIGSNKLGDKTSPTIYALQLPSTLNLSTDTDIKHSIASLANAVVMVRKFYSDLTAPPPSATSSKASGPVPAYLTAQIANYRTALQRLSGG